MKTGPTTRRRQLGATLRKLRERKGMTLEEAGKLVGVSKATISRYETKDGPVRWPVVDALCREYEATEAERAAVVSWAKAAREQGWWTSFGGPLPETLNFLLTLEDEAAREDHFATIYVPGLLQTPGYIKAVIQASETRYSADEVDRQVAIRMKRQEILHRAQPPHLWAVLDESVVRRVVGGPDVMRAQLTHLADCTESPNITIQIFPFATGAHATAMGSFVILGGPEASMDVVYVDFHTGALFLETEEELATYRGAFDYLRARALSPAESLAAIHRARKEMQ